MPSVRVSKMALWVMALLARIRWEDGEAENCCRAVEMALRCILARWQAAHVDPVGESSLLAVRAANSDFIDVV
jgi:hypothetical protein